MFYLNYDLARHITDQRRAEAMARSMTAAAEGKTKTRLRRRGSQEADVVELVFAPPCEQERIGA